LFNGNKFFWYATLDFKAVTGGKDFDVQHVESQSFVLGAAILQIVGSVLTKGGELDFRLRYNGSSRWIPRNIPIFVPRTEVLQWMLRRTGSDYG